MIDPAQQFKQALLKHRQSFTKSRALVFAALQDQEPQTMAELAIACHGQVDRASVYRTISLFERLGIVQRLQIGWKYKLELSDAFHHHHHHLTCLKCGQTIPIDEDNKLEERLKSLAQAHNFSMHGHQLEIHGLCQKCQSFAN